MKKVTIERSVVEWEYRALFGKTKVTWALAPVEWTVKDPRTQRSAARRLASRKTRNIVT